MTNRNGRASRTSTAFETAQDFAAHDLPVFPTHTVIDGRCSCGKQDCSSPGKHPRTPNGHKQATTDEGTLLHWNDQWPDANWALACGGFVSVIDIDTKAGADPAEIIGDYELAGPTVRTGEATAGNLAGERGAHVYCANGTRTGPTAVPGVEIRGAGAYVLLPGSRHASGVAYEWSNGARPWSGPLPPVPEHLVPRRAGSGRGGPPRDPDARVRHGERHTHLTDFAVRLVRAGVTSERVILAHLRTQFRETCEPEPEPEPGSIEALAAWAASSDIAGREQERQHATHDAKAALDEASRIVGMRPEDPLIHAWRESAHGDTQLSARTESGITLRWERQRDMLKVDDLLFPVLAVRGLPGPAKPVTKAQAANVYKLLVNATETFEQLDMRDETHEWIEGFEAIAVECTANLTDPATRFLAVRDLQHYQPASDDYGPVSRWSAPLILVDQSTGETYVSTRDLADHLRKERRITVAWPVLSARLEEIGWHHHDLQAWEPDVPRADAIHAQVRCYRRRGSGE